MYKYPLLFLLATIVFNFSSAQSQQLRVLSYNIRNAKGLDNVTNYQRIADILHSSKADVIALQELDSVTQRSKNEDVLKKLSSLTGMHSVYAPAIDFNGGKYGVGVLAKEKPLSFRYVSLPGREEKRVLLVVEFERYVFLCTHLSLTEEDRISSIDIINREAASFKKPVVLAGDLNDVPSSSFMQSLQQGWKLLSGEASTFPANQPDRCIDYILTQKQNPFKVRSSMVMNEPVASDHRPVLVELEW
jgi:endonuclease/exonuclease/phosphatase family metal-dependent hydrolase